MRIEIAQHGRMSESGSSLLRLIQNQDMPLLDLLVREAIQNSLDAANGKAFVNVDFSVRPFDSKALSRQLEGITEKLDQRFSGKSYDSLIISDSNTVGLTGPVRYEDVRGQDFGNCLKLIYEICKPQTNEGAGGSWGLGKTIYFRIGIGLVIYYSRILQDGKYKSRLAACLVEDETKKNSMIPSSEGVKRGIAWWGDAPWRRKTTVPIENERDIAKVLSVFNVRKYQNEETGTTIIIPYINASTLLQEVYAKNDEAEYKPYWAKSVEAYLKVAVQRWYAPRILNTSYNGAYLRPSIHNALIKVTELLPLFRVIRELYIKAVTGSVSEDSILAEEGADVHADDIRTREVFVRGTSSAGKFVYLKLSAAQLKMNPPENQKSPYQQVTNRVIPMENGNTPIIMYTRKPGMIVGYDFNGSWTHRMPKASEQEYIIGLFVANSSNRLEGILDQKNENLTLEEYIRQGEKADHASWSDRNIGGTNPRVISKVQAGIIRTISAQYKEKPAETVERKSTGLSHALANILLPSTDFGRNASVTPPKPPRPVTPSTGKVSFSVVGAPEFTGDNVTLPFEAFLKKGIFVIRLAIVTDYKKYHSDSWEKPEEIGKQFPLSVASMLVSSKKENVKGASWKAMQLELKEDEATAEGITLRILHSNLYHTPSSLQITCENSCRIKGKLRLLAAEPSLKVAIDVKEAQA